MAPITIAIPYYRNREYLRRAIESVFAQTVNDWSLVISDDAGPEGDLGDWLRATFPNAARIQYVRAATNLGMAGNWNRCFDLAGESPLVTLLHADDELDPNYVRTMTVAAERYPGAGAFFCQALIIDAEDRLRFSFPDWFKHWLMPRRDAEFVLSGETGLNAVMRGNFVMCPTLCYRMRMTPKPAFDDRWKQVLDLDFISRRLIAGDEFIGLPQHAYRYRRHSDNQTQKQSESLVRFEEERQLFLEIADRAESQRGWRRAAKTARRMSIIKCNLAYCIASDMIRLRPRFAFMKLRFLANLLFRRRAQ